MIKPKGNADKVDRARRAKERLEVALAAAIDRKDVIESNRLRAELERLEAMVSIWRAEERKASMALNFKTTRLMKKLA